MDRVLVQFPVLIRNRIKRLLAGPPQGMAIAAFAGGVT
jgi:hypothetical protein